MQTKAEKSAAARLAREIRAAYDAAQIENAAFDAARDAARDAAEQSATENATENATDATDATEKPDNAELRRAAIRTASQAFRAFASNASIPVKAIAAFGKAYAPEYGNAPACKPTPRQAAAIVVAAAAAGVKLPLAATELPVTFSRRFTLTDENGREYAAAIENGCNDNVGKSALIATYSQSAETYTVTHQQAMRIAAHLGTAELRKAGVIA